MARAWFRFYEELNDFLPPSRRKRDLELEFRAPAPVRHCIETLGVPHTEVELILANGLSVGLEHPIVDGDRVSIYPMFESLDVSPLLRVRTEPLRRTRFLVDAHLGRLARYLRMLGFDTRFDNDIGDRELARVAAAEKRILVTRDKALLMRRDVMRGVYLRDTGAREQLVYLINRLDLYRDCRPFSRCMHCNGMLQPAPKSSVLADLPPRTRELFECFWRCEQCGKVYWRGSHFERMQQLVERLLESRAGGSVGR